MPVLGRGSRKPRVLPDLGLPCRNKGGVEGGDDGWLAGEGIYRVLCVLALFTRQGGLVLPGDPQR